MEQVIEKNIVKLFSDNSEPFKAGDMIRDKKSDHIQVLTEHDMQYIDRDRMLQKWDRVTAYAVSKIYNRGDKITHNRDINDYFISTMDKMAVHTKDDYFKIIGKMSKKADMLIKGGFIKDGDMVEMVRNELHEESIPGHESDVTGYWFEIKCPCCGDFK